ncbi:MAG TPA: thioredoxin domain-containing protein, partial [Bacteroidota bacterium]|nr:thioredoxin domain-containing protein [Bacteroidota bacterium]
GGFYSAEDADSPRPDLPGESGEGAFYIWTKKEIDDALGADAPLFNECFGVEEGGNAPFDPQLEFTGRNILYARFAPGERAAEFRLSAEEAVSRLERAKERLFALRSLRPRPLRDGKILTSWNGLMIGAFARGGRILGDTRYRGAAVRAAGFITERLWKDGILYRRYREGESRFEAQLDDYAFLVAGLLDLFESSGEGRWLEHAVRLTERQIAVFHDGGGRGFFETSGSDRSVLVRMKEQYDGEEPSGNSVTAMNLLRLSRMIDRPEWDALGRETVANFGDMLQSRPSVIPLMAAALGLALVPPRQVVVAGAGGDPRTVALMDAVSRTYIPETVLIPLDPGSNGDIPRSLNPFLRNLTPIGDAPAAYVCRNLVCDLPVSSAESLANLLGADGGGLQ